jgi:hypothetical protein
VNNERPWRLWRALGSLLFVLAVPASASGYAAGEQWPSWGNTQFWSSSIADCTFAAAANWEAVVLHRTPAESEVISEFYAAGGNTQGGIDVETFEAWWRHHGIAGVRAQLRELPGEDVLGVDGLRLPERAVHRLRSALHRYHALIWEDDNHVALIVGYTAAGPLLASYGEVVQMSWSEWREKTWGVYRPELTH